MESELALPGDSIHLDADKQSSFWGVVIWELVSIPECILEPGRVQGTQGKDGIHSLPSPALTVLGPSWQALSLLFHG